MPIRLPSDFPVSNADLARFGRFCRRLVLDTGNPMILEPFQRTILRPYFHGVRETVAVLPTGNAKSTLLGAVAVDHMLETEDAECLIAAASADQAEIIFGQAAGLIVRSGLDDRLDIKRGIRAIYHKGDGPNRRRPGRIRVLSADVNKNDGAIPTLALVDELHRHRDGSMYGMFRDRLNKRHGRMITISTAGYDDASPLAVLRRKAHEHESFHRKGMYNHARIGPLDFNEWCLGETDDPHRLSLVILANPLKHITKEDLKARLESPTLVWAHWLRYTCGIWTAGEEPWLSIQTWEGLRADIDRITDGDEVFLAVRQAAGSGIGIVAPRPEGRFAVALEVIEPPQTGRVAGAEIESRLRRLCERYNVVEIDYDGRQFQRSADLLMEAGLPMVKIDQTPVRLSAATASLHRLISGRLLYHDGDPVLRAQALAGRATETTSGWHLVPDEHTAGLIAVAMACHEASKEPSPEPLIVLPSVMA
jgi:phage terminase large subunit-like protein